MAKAKSQEGFGRPASRHDGPHRQKAWQRAHRHIAQEPMANTSQKGRRKDMMLKNLLAETGTDSLHAYLRKHHG